MKKRLGLLGAAYHPYRDRLEEIIRKNDYVWSGWTYQIHDEKLKELKDQIEDVGFFYLYVHVIEKPSAKRQEEIGAESGSGKVDYRFIVQKGNFQYSKIKVLSPEPSNTVGSEREKPQRLWVRLYRGDIETIASKKWNSFTDYDLGKTFKELKQKYPWDIPDPYFLYVDDSDIN